VHLVKGAGPEAVADRFIGVFDKTLVKEDRPGITPMDFGGLAAAFNNGSNAAEVEQRLCAFKAFATRTEGGQQPGAINCAE
jgi:hypothetical protein